MLKRLTVSLVLTLAIASLLAWPVTYVGINFFAGLVFFSVLQFVGSYFYRDYMEKKLAVEEEKLIIAREAELSKQGATVTCPCDRGMQCFIPIKLNEPNEYSCPGCKKQVNVHINYKTAIATIPVVEDPETIVMQQLRSNLKENNGFY
jgi:hypothetical protein